eukprot:Transcript_3071.p1 GENE.Transcript_3071~~Transcript_3071.p1  ORF type:complete len:517 (-),score=86.82 Transcript_3071:47-1597(-)
MLESSWLFAPALAQWQHREVVKSVNENDLQSFMASSVCGGGNRLQECPAAAKLCPRRPKDVVGVNISLSLIWTAFAPDRPPAAPDQPALLQTGQLRQPPTTRLLLITITFPHALQLVKLESCVLALGDEPSVTWIVVEDAAARSAGVSAVLERWRGRGQGRDVYHSAVGPTRRGGNAQRDHALRLIRDQGWEGVVYNMDDDNGYHPRLWPALRAVGPGRVGALAVRRGVYPPPDCSGMVNRRWYLHHTTVCVFVERPVYDERDGALLRFDAGWCAYERSFLVRKHGPRRNAALRLDPMHRPPDERLVLRPHAFGPRLRRRLLPGHGRFCIRRGAPEAAAPRHLAAHLALRGARRRIGAGGAAARAAGRCAGLGLQPPAGFSSASGPHVGTAPEDLQPLANCGRDVLVFHNEFRSAPRAILHPPVPNCSADGWGAAPTAGAPLRRRKWERTENHKDTCSLWHQRGETVAAATTPTAAVASRRAARGRAVPAREPPKWLKRRRQRRQEQEAKWKKTAS